MMNRGTLVLSIIYNQCNNEDEKLFKAEKLIAKINQQKIYNYFQKMA